ncbi:ATP-binding protein [Alteromonas flava]|uniref:ATP-binding protein n=1 Tax=Alteromonas flava TaxID=2048003 RepID=UPI000C28F9C8|nr:ATP-binding protein [Alteromonas flava]
MQRLSLRVRSLLLAIASLVIIVPGFVFTVERSYTTSLEQAKFNELKLMSLAMISEFELDDSVPYMPQQLFEEKLNLLGSGYIGYIVWQQEVVWRSLSALDYSDPAQLQLPAVGDEQQRGDFVITRDFDATQVNAFYYAYSVEYEDRGQFKPVSFIVINEDAEFQQNRQTFINTLWQWLGVLSLLILATIILITRRVLAPVDSIIGNIRAAERGEIEKLTQTYPPELETLKLSINQLLNSEAQQRQRYKNSLGDLAHSLKTPLAVIQSTPQLPEHINEPLQQINAIIQRQLKRAVSGNAQRYPTVLLADTLSKLVGAMRKVYAEKSLTLGCDIEPGLGVKADETDLMELFGNLLDNACKSAQNTVQISANTFTDSIHIYVDDDGSGINEADANAILNRGERLDTYAEGQGIGLAVVIDLMETYNGQLRIERSPLGGARFTVQLPH